MPSKETKSANDGESLLYPQSMMKSSILNLKETLNSTTSKSDSYKPFNFYF
jgi:hypothetical protein